MLRHFPLTPFRRQLLGLIPPDVEHLAANPATAFVWPTENCSIGCAHCNFASRPRRPGAASDLRHDPAGLVGWLVEAGAHRLVLCGGGEPLDEPGFVRDVIAHCASSRLDFGIYTSGSSLAVPDEPERYIRDWKAARGDGHQGRFHVRLSLDHFHTQRLGTAVLAEWIECLARLVPDWQVSIRSLDVLGDRSLPQLAEQLGATVVERGRSSARLVRPGGAAIVVERMAFVVEGRGTPEVLTRHGLQLPEADQQTLSQWQELVGRTGQLGRPLSRRLTVGTRHVDLEIHADTAVHVLESQPYDARLFLYEYSWAQMRDLYYRDPVLHTVSAGGLELVASLLRSAIEQGVAPRSITPFSIEQIVDPAVLDWVTATAVLGLAPAFGYPEPAVALARERCGGHAA